MLKKLYVGIVTTKSSDDITLLRQHILDTCGYECTVDIVKNDGNVGLTKIYKNYFLTKPSNDVLVLVHDDVEFLRKGWGEEIMRLFNSNQEYGIIGVAGSAQFDDRAMWWNYDKKFGQVLHRHNGQSWLSEFSPLLKKDLQEVCVIDGLFMAICPKRITQTFDTTLDGFDFYDIDFCLANYLDGKTKIGVTTNIRLAHNSIGQLKPSWFINKDKVIEKYKNNFPIQL